MKKAFTLLAVTLMASFASAVTINWDRATWTQSTTGKVSNGDWQVNTFTRTNDFAIRVTYSGTTASTLANTRLLKMKNSTNQWFVLEYVSSNQTIHGAASEWDSNDVYKEGSSSELSIVANSAINLSLVLKYNSSAKQMDFYAVDNNAKITVKVASVDAETMSTDALSFGSGGVFEPENATYANPLSNLFTDDTTYTVEYTYDISQLPEPTALALLALGVAGLALKRKIA